MTKCTGIYMMSIERVDQVLIHGYDLEHDKQHSNGELIQIAQDYLAKGNLKDLVKAGALIAAEIDRIQGVDFMESPRK